MSRFARFKQFSEEEQEILRIALVETRMIRGGMTDDQARERGYPENTATINALIQELKVGQD